MKEENDVPPDSAFPFTSNAWWKASVKSLAKPLTKLALTTVAWVLGLVFLGAAYPHGLAPMAEYDAHFSRYNLKVEWTSAFWIAMLELYWMRGLIIVINLCIVVLDPLAQIFNWLVRLVK